jgi:hypothetical protein
MLNKLFIIINILIVMITLLNLINSHGKEAFKKIKCLKEIQEN